ncbi:MAG TPA: hypothetical protein DEA08_19390 [Planctomycetes bacterium]|nr:hypothetical protein [Planctomycetota bacterium]
MERERIELLAFLGVEEARALLGAEATAELLPREYDEEPLPDWEWLSEWGVGLTRWSEATERAAVALARALLATTSEDLAEGLEAKRKQHAERARDARVAREALREEEAEAHERAHADFTLAYHQSAAATAAELARSDPNDTLRSACASAIEAGELRLIHPGARADEACLRAGTRAYELRDALPKGALGWVQVIELTAFATGGSELEGPGSDDLGECLYGLLDWLSRAEILALVREELEPWARGERDPVSERV